MFSCAFFFFSRQPSCGCCIKCVGPALVTGRLVFSTVLEPTTLPTLNHKKRESQNTLLRGPSTPTEGRVRSTNKTVHSNTGATGICANTRTWKGLSLRVRCCFADAIKNPCIFQVHFESHWTRHDIVFRGMPFSAHRQLLSFLSSTAFANDW